MSTNTTGNNPNKDVLVGKKTVIQFESPIMPLLKMVNKPRNSHFKA